MRAWGDVVVETVSVATTELRLVAPFIKKDALSRVLYHAHDAADVHIYTRWRPDEIAAGVSDLEVLDIVRARPRTSLLLCTSLHAKYYRADGRVLLGSANLTRAALGWAAHSNLELLFETAWPSSELRAFEETLVATSVMATDEIRDSVAASASLLGTAPPVDLSALTSGSSALFLPKTRNPDLLFAAYSGNAEELTGAAREQTALDLAALEPPRGLNEDQFTPFIAVLLMQAPNIAALDQFLAEPRRFGEVRRLLADLLATHRIERDPSEAWQTLMRWLLFFLPGRYRVAVPGYSEVFSRIRQ